MKRREFIAAGISLAGICTVRLAFGQPAPQRGAVVIGVDKPGDLPTLRAARTGAQSVAAWLTAEGFDVKLLVDDPTPVTAHDVFNAVKAFVDRGTLHQLVVYFAGHGFISGSLSEYWLLSGAPDNPNEAVSLTTSKAFAKQSGIPNVVFISDACRSQAESVRLLGVTGSQIFPSRSSETVSDVDVFLATRIGDAAYEASVAANAAEAEGIYTSCFLDAFKNPYPTIVQEVGGIRVIPNRRLKTYLATEVPKRARARSITLKQQPDSEVNSDEPTYIGRVTGSVAASGAGDAPSVSDVAKFAWAGGDASAAPQFSSHALQELAASSGFERAQNTIVAARGLPAHLSARTGFSVLGHRVVAATARGAGVIFDSERTSALVEVDLRGKRATSVALRFGDGSGTVLAALDGFIGNVVVDQDRVVNVSYVPSRQNDLRTIYEHEEERINQMHASVATAARFGVFRIEGPKQTRQRLAAQLADRIRMLKGIDPTLGLYAAYAYADAGLRDRVNSVRGYMRGDLSVDLFDVAMLAGALSGRSVDGHEGPVPFCPMLSQGWELLRVNGVRLPDDVEALRSHLRRSLWSTIDGAGMEIAERILRG